MTNEKKCKYCERMIDSSCIRCYKCDSAWQEGYYTGWNEHQNKIKETIEQLDRQ